MLKKLSGFLREFWGTVFEKLRKIRVSLLHNTYNMAFTKFEPLSVVMEAIFWRISYSSNTWTKWSVMTVYVKLPTTLFVLSKAAFRSTSSLCQLAVTPRYDLHKWSKIVIFQVVWYLFLCNILKIGLHIAGRVLKIWWH